LVWQAYHHARKRFMASEGKSTFNCHYLLVSGPWADVEVTQLQLNELAVSVSEVLNAKTGEAYKNVLRDTGYIGGFNGFKSGQRKYQEISSQGQVDDSGTSRSTERWGGHADRVEAKRAEIRGFTEKFIKDNPLHFHCVRFVATCMALLDFY
jgi:hypothetical protein